MDHKNSVVITRRIIHLKLCVKKRVLVSHQGLTTGAPGGRTVTALQRCTQSRPDTIWNKQRGQDGKQT